MRFLMSKTKEQLYNELEEIVTSGRKEIKEVLDELLESGMLKAHLVSVPDAAKVINKFNISEKSFQDSFSDYSDLEYRRIKKFCEHRGVSLFLLSGVNSNKVFFGAMSTTNTVVDDLFYNSGDTTYQSKLKELIEDYFEDTKLFIRFLYESGIISTNIYDDSWYEDADLTKVQEVLAKYEQVFKEQVNKLEEIENSLLECENKLNDILSNFPDGLSEYLKNLGYEEK